MFPIQQAPFAGFFRTGDDDTPGVSFCSISAAIQQGQVARYYIPGYLYRPKYGKLSLVAAIEEGLIDQKAADIIAALPGCFNPHPPVPATVKAPASALPGTLRAYDGTPIGKLVEVLQAWAREPYSVDASTKLAAALEAAIGKPAGD